MIEVSALTEHADLQEAVRLQKEIWGFAEVELLPVRLFVVATKVGKSCNCRVAQFASS